MTTFDTSQIDKIPSGHLVQNAWDRLVERFDSVRTGTQDAHTTWSTLNSQLKLPPEMTGLYAALDEPKTIMSNIETATSTAGGAVGIFAEELRTCNDNIRQVRRDIDAYHATYPAGAELDEAQERARQAEERRINGVISQIEFAFSSAGNTFNNSTSAIALAVAQHVTIHFPGGSDATERNQAAQLAESLRNGTSKDPKADFAKLRTLLGKLEPHELERWAREHPELNMTVPPQGVDPRENRTWWDGLRPDQKAALQQNLPGIVGNLEGLSYADRRVANEKNLEIMRTRVNEQLNGTRHWNLSNDQILAIQKLDSTVQNGRERHTDTPAGVGLLSFDPVGVDGQPLAAIVMGDLDTATHQSWYIPGMGSFLKDNVGGVFGDAESIYRAQQQHLGAGESNAMVMWMGYDAPTAPHKGESLGSSEVLRSTHAREGGERLQYALNGMNVLNENRGIPKPYTSVTAHSYGTTTATYALSKIDHNVNSVVFFGSAGLDRAAATSAWDFKVERDPNTGRPAVYSGTSMEDNIARLPMQYGSQEGWGPPRYSPTDGHFGGNVFQVDGENGMKETSGHEARKPDGKGYLDSGTQSLEAISSLSVGKGDHVTLTTEANKDHLYDIVNEAMNGIPDTDGEPQILHKGR